MAEKLCQLKRAGGLGGAVAYNISTGNNPEMNGYDWEMFYNPDFTKYAISALISGYGSAVDEFDLENLTVTRSVQTGSTSRMTASIYSSYVKFTQTSTLAEMNYAVITSNSPIALISSATNKAQQAATTVDCSGYKKVIAGGGGQYGRKLVLIDMKTKDMLTLTASKSYSDRVTVSVSGNDVSIALGNTAGNGDEIWIGIE